MVEKVCRKCGKTRPLDDFYRDRNAKDGRRGSCIECDKRRKRTEEVRAQRRKYNDSEKGRAAQRRYVESGKKAVALAAYVRPPESVERAKRMGRVYGEKYASSDKGKAYYGSRRKTAEYREYYRAYMKQYLSDPVRLARFRERARLNVQRRDALKRSLPATLTQEDWLSALRYFGHRCAYCGSEKPLEQEHFIPLIKGGPYTPENIVPACDFCNTSKGGRSPEDWCSPEAYERVMAYFASLG